METTPANLDALGLKTTDLERVQESFSRLWYKHDFWVKTFQEGLGLTGVHLGALGNKVVPDYSSLLGDHRERAETLQANHMEMCRFSREDDPNYRKVAGEIRSIYLSMSELTDKNDEMQARMPGSDTDLADIAPRHLTRVRMSKMRETETSYLESLWFPSINARYQDVKIPAKQTCDWLFEHELYLDWLNDRKPWDHRGFLWLKGKPGAGKSVLMKEAFRRASSQYMTAAFFFSAKGDELQHSPVGLFRSLLYQLLPQSRHHLRQFSDRHIERSRGGEETSAGHWREPELQAIFQDIYRQTRSLRTIIFIDALDECDGDKIRSLSYFWRQVTLESRRSLGYGLSVCISSRHFPTVTLSNSPEIIVEHHNEQDIDVYVDQRLRIGMAVYEPQWLRIKRKIMGRSAGVFLWVVLVVDDVLSKWDDGMSLRYLLRRIHALPQALDKLFSEMFISLDPHDRQLTARVFQWAILAAKPLRLHEWHHILAFVRHPPPSSLHDWRESDYFTKNDDQLERQIRSISKGLIEVKNAWDVELPEGGFETSSVRAGAGSLTIEHGETRIIQVIHESVREFFMLSNGFEILDSNLASNPIGNGHLSIMGTCIDYLNIKELDALVQARKQEHQRDKLKFQWDSSSMSESLSIPSGVLAQSVSRFTASPKDLVGISPSLAKTETLSVFEEIRRLNDSAKGVNIDEWIATHGSVVAQPAVNDARSYTTQASLAGQSQRLEDYPALLSYATFELFTHAELAQKYTAYPSSITSRLSEHDIWARWLILREDLPTETTLIDYFIQRGLDSWVLATSTGVPTEKPPRKTIVRRVMDILGQADKNAPAKKVRQQTSLSSLS
jgi:hypothetical protein